ncbi:MAG: hypothetical protein ACYSVY_04530 [Planctomycetota bacterium]|jgi:hypothetical protein
METAFENTAIHCVDACRWSRRAGIHQCARADKLPLAPCAVLGFWAVLIGLIPLGGCQSGTSGGTLGDQAPEPGPAEAAEIRGTVRSEAGPVVGAVVRVQATHVKAVTTDAGCFALPVSELAEQFGGQPLALTAWAPGYYIVGPTEAQPGDGDVIITLEAHTGSDNTQYEWLEANLQDDERIHCAQCHSEPDDPNSLLPFDEWQADAHGQSASNPRFLSMYRGEDLAGNRSPNTRYGHHIDYGRFALPPDPARPYYGPGFKLDFPEQAGNCAACHLPAAAANAPYETDPDQVTGVGTEGIACDLCHKIWAVQLDPTSGLPRENMPGVLSMEFRRPEAERQLFVGPFDDVAPGDDTYSALYGQSRYCAACHFAKFWGVQIYNSFGEWLESPYSNPETGRTCQDCHMPSRGATHFALPEEGGLHRDPATIFSHRMPGAADEELLQNAVTMTFDARMDNASVAVQVDITNDQTGHHVPTDSPLRHLILLVSATDADGNSLRQTDGPTVPEWGGVGDPADGGYAGLPGKAFARVLEELWTEVSPTGAYWSPTRVLTDNRIAAFATDSSTYAFTAPATGHVTVEVTLLFRRAYHELMQQKEWDVPDIVMEETTAVISSSQPTAMQHWIRFNGNEQTLAQRRTAFEPVPEVQSSKSRS